MGMSTYCRSVHLNTRELYPMNAISYPLKTQIPKPAEALKVAPGVYWIRMPIPSSLDHINLYLLEDVDGWYIVDSGLGTSDTKSLWQSIFNSALGDKPVKGLIVTHMHPDHIGLAGWITEHWQVPMYMSKNEFDKAHLVYKPRDAEHYDLAYNFYLRFGMEPGHVQETTQLWLNFKWPLHPLPKERNLLKAGDTFSINQHDWQILIGYGHSPEHACLYCPSLNLLISGDQILPEISSNVSIYPDEQDADPLAGWLESLRAFEQLPADCLVLPAHNNPFFGLHPRARAISKHHEQNCEALVQACDDLKTGLELLPVLFKRQLNKFEWTLAIGECSAHLNYLVAQQRLERITCDQGVHRYRRVES